MNILINFSTLKSGGGQNVGLNFISTLSSESDKYFFLVAKNSLIHKFLIDNGYESFKTTPNNPFARIIFELFYSRKILTTYEIDVIYSYFGYGLFPKSIPQIIGAADSNLFFSEIDFWKGYRGFPLLKKRLVDKFRIWGLKKANGIIFENRLLEIKCHELFKVKAITTTINPSINLNYEQKEYKLPQASINMKIKQGLFLCGWHLNKNVLLIPAIAHHLKMLNIDFHFILTAPIDNSSLHKNFNLLIEKFNVNDMISIVGPIKKEELSSLYNQVDFVFLLSKLESFSNNIIEAWSFKRLLVISDEPWARGICGNGAVYVNRESAVAIADKIKSVLSNPDLCNSTIEHGYNNLNGYPHIEERVSQEISFIKKVYEKI